MAKSRRRVAVKAPVEVPAVIEHEIVIDPVTEAVTVLDTPAPEYDFGFNDGSLEVADKLAVALNANVLMYDTTSVTLRSNINSVEACANIEQPFDDIVRAFRSMGL